MKLRSWWLGACFLAITIMIRPTLGAAAGMRITFTGGFHTLALQKDGSLWAWGENDYAQLGLGDTTNRNTLNKVTGTYLWGGSGKTLPFSLLLLD